MGYWKAAAFLDKFRPIQGCNELGINFATRSVSNNEGLNAGKSHGGRCEGLSDSSLFSVDYHSQYSRSG
jgi:hypothetical protein